ncbi:form3 [Trypoxylus dichotomus]
MRFSLHGDTQANLLSNVNSPVSTLDYRLHSINGSRDILVEIDEREEIVDEDNREESRSVRKSNRERKRPEHLKDFLNEEEIEHIALNATSFVEELPTNLDEAKTRSDTKLWEGAIEQEKDALRRNNTWTLVKKPENVKLINSKLVAKGFMQREGFDLNETYAPVARLKTVRTLLAVANFKNLDIQQMDVKSAFLHGKVEENIYMNVPDGFEDSYGRVCKLNKALYGLK